MTERNPYSPYNFDSYDNEKRKAAVDPNAGSGNVRKAILAGVGVLIAGAAFAAIVIASYPNSNPSGAPPVIHADGGDIIVAPNSMSDASSPGGAQQQPSDVLAAAPGAKEAPPVENLLSKEQPMNKLEAFAHQAESIYSDKGKQAAVAPSAGASPAPTNITAPVAPVAPSPQPLIGGEAKAPSVVAGEETTPAPTLLKKSAAKAGTSPQTMAYVKSELQKAPAAKAAAKIAPAAGAATPAAKAASPGKYYLQLGSVSSESGAATQWTKLQKQFPASLKAVSYRVQKADVAGKGTFYRIQAGPMSKDDASNKCGAIKIDKPGGCIVVQ